MSTTTTQLEKADTIKDRPPAYDDITTDSDGSLSEDGKIEHWPTKGLSLPCVIPQTTKSHRGAFFSPFVRAYPKELDAHGISQSDFLTFIDGLNEAFVAHPIYQGLGVVGGVLQMVQGTATVEYAGMGLQAAAGAASAATSYFRTRAYVKAMNTDIFYPVGLRVNILNTKKMMERVGYPEEKLNLPRLEYDSDLLAEYRALKPREAAQAYNESSPSSENDPRIRRMKALEGCVTPINLDVPNAPAPDTNNFLKKMSASHAARMEKKQNRRLNKQQTKAQARQIRSTRGVERAHERREARLDRLETNISENQSELEKLNLTENPSREDKQRRRSLEKEQRKLERRQEKTNRKAEKRIEKKTSRAEKAAKKMGKREDKTARKIRWIVISKREYGDDDSEVDSYPESDGEGGAIRLSEKE